MAYNHGREDRKWRIWKEAEEKLPKMDVLKEEGRKLTAKKKQLYGEYQKARRDMQELVTIKANIDTLMGYTEPGRKQEKER